MASALLPSLPLLSHGPMDSSGELYATTHHLLSTHKKSPSKKTLSTPKSPPKTSPAPAMEGQSPFPASVKNTTLPLPGSSLTVCYPRALSLPFSMSLTRIAPILSDYYFDYHCCIFPQSPQQFIHHRGQGPSSKTACPVHESLRCSFQKRELIHPNSKTLFHKSKTYARKFLAYLPSSGKLTDTRRSYREKQNARPLNFIAIVVTHTESTRAVYHQWNHCGLVFSWNDGQGSDLCFSPRTRARRHVDHLQE